MMIRVPPHSAPRLLLALCASAACLPVGAAPAAPEADLPTLPVMTVTASKENTTVFDTPASVSVVDGSQVEREGLRHLDDLAQQLPNVYFSDFSGGPGTLVIRGMGNGDEESDVASVGAQIDGVPLPLTSHVANLFDLDHIEVLRGPQSVMHGQGHIGGLVALRSRDPGFSLGGSVQADYGSDALRRLSAAIDLPLAEKTALRISVGREQSDGHTHNTTLDRHDSAGWQSNFARLKLLHKDDSGGEWRIGLHHLDRNGGNDLFLRQAGVGARESVESNRGVNDLSYTLLSGEYTRPLDARTRLTATLGVSQAEWRYWTPTSLFGATNGYDMTLKGYSGEVRIQRDAVVDSPFDWLAGFNIGKTRLDRPYLYDYVPYFRSATGSQVDGLAVAAFAQAGWHVAPGWRLAAGLRVAHDQRDLDWRSDQNGAVSSLQRSVSNTVWLPQVSVEYRPDGQQFVWAKLARGYKAAGFNVYATRAVAAGDPYDPEYANHAEIGYRIQDDARRWSASAVVFHSRLRDQQVVITGQGGATMTDNAGRSHSEGIELEARFRPLRQLELSAFAGHVKAVYDEYQRGASNYAGQQFTATPRSSYGLALAWRPAPAWEFGLSARRIGKVYLQTSRQEDPAYTLVDAQLSWHHDTWTVGLYGRNLTDARYLTRAIGDGMGGTLVSAGAPRSVGMRVAYDF